MHSAGVGLLVAALVLARLLPAGDVLDRLWAEDGRVFLSDAERHGLGSLVYVYGSYLHVVPRVLALAGGVLPLEHFARFAVLAAAAVTGLLGAFVHAAAADVTGSRRLALIPALALALVPALSTESLGNLANLHWYLVHAAFWALLAGPRLRHAAVVVCAAAALSSAIAVLLVPVALHREGRQALRRRPVQALLAGAALQALAILLAPRSARAIERHPGVDAGLPGDAVTGILGLGLERGASIAIGLALAALTFLAWRRAATGPRRDALRAWAAGLVLYATVVVITGETAQRYDAMAAMFIAAGVCLLMKGLDRVAAAGAVGVMALLAAGGFPASESRVYGPSWEQSVERLETACAGDPEGERDVPLSPYNWGSARLPCDG